MRKQRVIVVGAGFWGKRWIEAVVSRPDVELAAVVARTEATLLEVRDRHRLDRAACFTGLPQALRAVDAQIVVVVSPAAAHRDHVTEALNAGKHVICEKPLADSWDAARAIATAVRAHPKRKFMVSQTRRFTGRVETLRQAIASGRIGTVDTISFDHRVNYTGGGYRQKMDYPVLQDMICHHLDALRYVTGQEPVSVLAESWNPAWSQFSGKASTALWATMTGGIRIQYFGSWTARGQLNSYDGALKVMGSEGSLDLVDDRTLLLYPYTGAEQAPGPEPQRLPIVELGSTEIMGVVESFLAAIRDGTEPPCGIGDNLRTFAWNCAAIESCRARRTVDLREMQDA